MPLQTARTPRLPAALRSAGLAGLLLLGGACRSTIVPPPVVADPVRIHLLREALHIGLIVPAIGTTPEAGGFVEFGFGEWAWYAENRTAWYRAFPTVLWSTPATLSRRTIQARSHGQLRRLVEAIGIELDDLEVERLALEALRDRLQSEFDRPAPEVLRRDSALGPIEFLPVEKANSIEPGGYWAWRNCADEVATWLEELGCRTGFALIRTGLKVKNS